MADAQIDDVFNATIKDLTDQADTQATAMFNSDLRPWNRPKSAPNNYRWSGDPLDIADTVWPFDRTTINTKYEEGLASTATAGKVADAIALKGQCDYIAMAERGYRARHCTPVRLLAMSIARRIGHGNPAGVFSGGMKGYITNTIRTGKSSPPLVTPKPGTSNLT
jgi:hypothetical protein